ncbi:MAG: protein kinase family protein [Propionibacteriaceae bacterium]|jgi:hypothetical protein|nr:protein kinase family protein [Propionibacteriaceae bacterium]
MVVDPPAKVEEKRNDEEVVVDFGVSSPSETNDVPEKADGPAARRARTKRNASTRASGHSARASRKNEAEIASVIQPLDTSEPAELESAEPDVVEPEVEDSRREEFEAMVADFTNEPTELLDEPPSPVTSPVVPASPSSPSAPGRRRSSTRSRDRDRDRSRDDKAKEEKSGEDSLVGEENSRPDLTDTSSQPVLAGLEPMVVGALVGDRYRLTEALGQEGIASRWVATDEVLARTVMVWTVEEQGPRADRVLKAAQRAAAVMDARFVRVLDAGLGVDGAYVVSEWIEGTTLSELLSSVGPLQGFESAWLMHEITDALAGIHALHLAHGRIDPRHILVTSTGSVRLASPAVVAAVEETGNTSKTVTVDDDDDPAQRARRERRDLVDCGKVLYACLTARWIGSSDMGLPEAPRSGEGWESPIKINPGASVALDRLVYRILSPSSTPRQPVLETAADIDAEFKAIIGPVNASADLRRRVESMEPPLDLFQAPPSGKAAVAAGSANAALGSDRSASSREPDAATTEAGLGETERGSFEADDAAAPASGSEDSLLSRSAGDASDEMVTEVVPPPDSFDDQAEGAAAGRGRRRRRGIAQSPVIVPVGGSLPGSGADDRLEGSEDSFRSAAVDTSMAASSATAALYQRSRNRGATDSYDHPRHPYDTDDSFVAEDSLALVTPVEAEGEEIDDRRSSRAAGAAGAVMAGAAGAAGAAVAKLARVPDRLKAVLPRGRDDLKEESAVATSPVGERDARTWALVRLILIVVIILAILTAIIVALYRSAGGGDDDPAAPPATPTSEVTDGTGGEEPVAERIPVPIIGSAVMDAANDGGDASENNQWTYLAYDHDAETYWTTEFYGANFGFGTTGKPGVGIVVDFGSPATIDAADFILRGEPSTLQIRVPEGDAATVEEAPMDSSNQWRTVATVNAPMNTATTSFESVTTRYVLVYFTALPEAEPGRLQGGITEMEFFSAN